MPIFDVVNEAKLVKAAWDAGALPPDIPVWLAQFVNTLLDGRVVEISHPALAQPIRVSFPAKDKDQ